MEEQTSKLLTVKQAAEYVQMSVFTIHKALTQGELKGYRLGGRKGKRTTIAYLDEWIASKAIQPPNYRRSA